MLVVENVRTFAHFLRCNPRPDADAPPDPNSAAGAGTSNDNRVIIPPNAPGGVPADADLWELALRIGLQNPPDPGLNQRLADAPVPIGFDAHTIIRWTTNELAPLLWARPHDQDMFLEVVRQQPNVIQSLFIQSLGDPRSLVQGVEMTMMQARLQQRQRQNMRRARDGLVRVAVDTTPQTAVQDADVAMRDGAVAAVRQHLEANRTRRDARVQARNTGPPAENTTGRGMSAPVPPPGTWVNEIPAFRATPLRTTGPIPIVPPTPPTQTAAAPAPTTTAAAGPRLPLFGFGGGRNEAAAPADGRTDRQADGARGFSLTEVWRNLGRGNNNNHNSNNNNNTNNTDTNPDNQGRR